MNLNNERGFSLVELMVVVSILGVLSSLATQSYTQFTAKARISRVASELASLRGVVESVKAGVGYYPRSNGWTSALPFGTEYQVDCTTVATGGGAENDQGLREICEQMSVFQPEAPGMPALSPYCGEPRNYLYISNGVDYQLMAYCFEHAELSALARSRRCANGECWGLGFASPGGEGW